jgi:hypothetical protein
LRTINPVIAGTACSNANRLLGNTKDWFENDKEFWLLFLSPRKSTRIPVQLYMRRPLSWDIIPAEFRQDPEVAILFACRHCDNVDDLASILSDVPNLLSAPAKEDLIALVQRILPYECGEEWVDVLDELEIEWQSNLDLCTEVLRWKKEFLAFLPKEMRTREFVEIALQEPMTAEQFNAAITPDVQRRFPELVADWFSRFPTSADISMRITDEVWANRTFVLAWIKAVEWDVRNRSRSASTRYRNDREVMLALAKHDPAGFASACSLELRSDKEFMLHATKSKQELLKCASIALRRSFGFLLEVISHDSDTVGFFYDDERSNGEEDAQGVTTFFDEDIDGDEDNAIGEDEDVNGDRDVDGDVDGVNQRRDVPARHGADGVVSDLHEFARLVRERSCDYLQFRILLFGMSSARLKGKTDGPIPIALLDQGSDTSIAYKSRIAEFVGVPTGAELQKLVKASAALARWGY